MKPYITHTLLWRSWRGAVFALPLLFASCVTEDYNPSADCDLSESLTINLELTVPSESTTDVTRAGDSTHVPSPGNEAENYIDVQNDDFCVLVYDAENGSLITEMDMLSFRKVSDTGTTVTYNLLGEVDLRT